MRLSLFALKWGHQWSDRRGEVKIVYISGLDYIRADKAGTVVLRNNSSNHNHYSSIANISIFIYRHIIAISGSKVNLASFNCYPSFFSIDMTKKNKNGMPFQKNCMLLRPSTNKCMFSFCLESNFLKFDQLFTKK
jgi:hypothetical protein